jgi:hypothetical protein
MTMWNPAFLLNPAAINPDYSVIISDKTFSLNAFHQPCGSTPESEIKSWLEASPGEKF